MGYMCDFCGDQRSMVYCRSDAASLCLSCDRNVHSANALSKRHSRTLLCERCNSQPAFVRYVEERISLCQSCDWMNHGTSTSVSSHKRHTISSYSGCPSAAELSSIWSFVTDSPTAHNSSCQQDLGLMSISENSVVPPESRCRGDDSNDELSLDNSGVWPSLANEPNSDVVHPNASSDYKLAKSGCHRTRCSGLCEDVGLYEDFSMDEVDLNLENYDELFGINLNQSEKLFENGGIDSLFGPNYMSCAEANNEAQHVAEGSTAGVDPPIQPAYSNIASADSMMSSKTEPVLCFSTRRANSSLTYSGHEESSIGDHQDCGASTILLVGESPWCPPPCRENSLTSFSRSSAVMRYKEKKKSRKFQKSIRYASRKARADVRKRVKGRFIKAGDAYDYDPLSQTRSC